MTKITVHVEGHYEVHEAPFFRAYEWHPTYATIECDCGEKLTLAGSSNVPACRCDADHSAIIQDIQEREGRSRHEVTHPWQHDSREQEEQHLRDETTHSEGSSWRYNDITLGGMKGV